MSAHPASQPGAPVAPDPRRWLALFVLLIANFMNLIDVTIVNVALPSMREGLGALRPARLVAEADARDLPGGHRGRVEDVHVHVRRVGHPELLLVRGQADAVAGGDDKQGAGHRVNGLNGPEYPVQRLGDPRPGTFGGSGCHGHQNGHARKLT